MTDIDIKIAPDGYHVVTVSLDLDIEQINAIVRATQMHVRLLQEDIDALRNLGSEFDAFANAELKEKRARLERVNAMMDRLVICREVLEATA